MARGVVRTFDLCPDGVRIIVPWDAIAVGMSVFIPCLDAPKAIDEFEKIASSRGWYIDARIGINKGKYGVRIWRVM